MTSTTDGARQRRRRYGAPKNWRDQFLTALAETSNVSASAAAADISVSWVYKTRREDRSFSRRWQAALCEGYDHLEIELLHRLRLGINEATDEDGAKRKFDNAGALRLLAMHRASVSRERALREHESEEEILASINAKLDTMRARQKAVAAMLAEGDDEGE